MNNRLTTLLDNLPVVLGHTARKKISDFIHEELSNQNKTVEWWSKQQKEITPLSLQEFLTRFPPYEKE